MNNTKYSTPHILLFWMWCVEKIVLFRKSSTFQNGWLIGEKMNYLSKIGTLEIIAIRSRVEADSNLFHNY